VDKTGNKEISLVVPIHIWNSFWKFRASPLAAATPAPAKEVQPARNASPWQRPPFPAPEADDGLTAQEKYDLLSEHGTHILCIIDRKEGCTYLSKNFETITGTSCDSMMGKKLQTTLHPDFHERFETALREAGRPPLRCKLKHADGKWYWYQMQIRARNGATDAFVCVMENIHDMISTQNVLQKARLEAELALRARSEFLANMSHELRTPLNAVIGFSQIIDSEIFGKIENTQYKEYVRHIQDSGYDLLAKIEDLLEIANIDAGRVTLSKEEVALSEILQFVMQAQGHHAQAAKVDLTCSKQQEMTLHVDRLKLQHILGHLAANAIRHSKIGGTVFISAVPAEGGLDIMVRDTGCGISQDKLGAILTALQEENCWTSSNEHGAVGLGLALTREFVALHGGQVDVSSTAGQGTTITISLPKECIRQLQLPHAVKQTGYLQAVS
jgi:PAS domain S-box-containing protein